MYRFEYGLTTEDLWTYLIIIAGSVIVWFVIILYRRWVKQSVDTPILAGHGLLEADILPATSGKIDDFTYNVIVNSLGRMIYTLYLGYNSGLHVVAYGDKSNMDAMLTDSIKSKWLEPVVLEGDFPDYFKLYCTPGRQVELLQMFSPDTMLEFIEFCRAYDFEIAYESLYVSQAGDADDETDTTPMLDDVEKFVKDNAYLLHNLQRPRITVESVE